MTISIIGHGYVGLVTATVFAELGNTVWVVGRNKDKIKRLQNGDPIIFEPGLKELLQRNLKAGRIQFTCSFGKSIPASEVVFICVGTPPKENGEADLSNVLTVAKSIGNHIKKYTVISCKSTVPVGTNKKIKEIINKDCKVALSLFDIASCPEFLREGTGISDTFHPDRIVIGTENSKAQKVLLDFHAPITGERVLTSIETAEMIKYASNSLLATKISFANLIAFLSEKVGADAEKVLTGVGFDKRLGRNFLYPGAGYGGSCLPKDVKALIKVGELNGVDMSLLQNVETINTHAIELLLQKVIMSIKSRKIPVVALLGLAFKPDTDDVREAPSVKFIQKLIESNSQIKIQAYDPIVKSLQSLFDKNMIYCRDPYEAGKGADAVVVITEWNEFRKLDLKNLKKQMRGSALIDGRNIYKPEEVKKLGFEYWGVGRR